MELQCPFQSYAWGKLGLSSAVASLKASSDPTFSAQETSPYAELWMGTHPNGPAKLKDSGESLEDHISKDPAVLGGKCREAFGDQLPFLFKVLSVNKALSIQTHPDKGNAEKLHQERPEVYKDPNHKPEMAIALTEFEGLCGFRPLSEIQGFLQSVAQLRNVVGVKESDDLVRATKNDYSETLRAAFTSLMRAEKVVLARELDSLRAEIASKEAKGSTDLLFLRLLDQYPGDVGCLVIYFVNHLTLRPGEAMFLGPNLIHAYLSGDCMECMACSDNVVRAGLTPKLIDVPTLCSLLRYECAPGESMKFEPKEDVPGVTVYNPPVEDFAVARVLVGAGKTFSAPPRGSASICIVTEGAGALKTDLRRDEPTRELRKGTTVFLAAGEVMELTASDQGGLEIFQAYC